MCLVDSELVGYCLWVAIGSALPAKCDHHIGKPSVVLHPPLGAASLTLLLLLSLDLRGEETQTLVTQTITQQSRLRNIQTRGGVLNTIHMVQGSLLWQQWRFSRSHLWQDVLANNFSKWRTSNTQTGFPPQVERARALDCERSSVLHLKYILAWNYPQTCLIHTQN